CACREAAQISANAGNNLIGISQKRNCQFLMISLTRWARRAGAASMSEGACGWRASQKSKGKCQKSKVTPCASFRGLQRRHLQNEPNRYAASAASGWGGSARRGGIHERGNLRTARKSKVKRQMSKVKSYSLCLVPGSAAV